MIGTIQNKLSKRLALALSAAMLLVLFSSTQVMAANITQSTGDAATNATTNLSAAAVVSGVDWVTMSSNHTLTIATTPFVIYSADGTSAGLSIASASTSSFIAADGKELTVTGTGTAAGGAFIFNLGSGTAGTTTLNLNGDTYASQHAIEVLNPTDATRIVNVNIGDGTGTTTFAGVIDLGNAAGGNTVLTLNGAIISGAITDNAANDTTVINVTGDSTLSAANDLASTNAGNTVTITDGVTLTLGDSLTLGVAGKFVLGTSTAGGTLTLAGIDTYLGLIDGPSAGVGTLDINAASTVTSIVGGTNALALIDIGAATTFSAAVSATTMNISGDFAVTATGTFTGNTTVTTTNQGTIVTVGAISLTGSIGASDKLLKLLDVNHTLTTGSTVHATGIDTAAVTHTASGDLTAAYNFSADGTLALADGSDVTGAITAGTSDQGNITVAGVSVITGEVGSTTGPKLLNAITVGDGSGTDSLTVNGNLHATDTAVAAGATLAFSHATAAAMAGTLTTAGTTGKVDVGTATVTVTGAVNIVATSTLKVTIGDTNGKLVATAANLTMNAASLIEPVIAGRITSGTAITIAQSGAAITASTAAVVESYSRYTFAVAQCNTNDLCLTPTAVTPTGLSGAGGAVNAVADVAFASDSTMNDAINSLSGESLNKALKTLAPAVDGGAIVGAVSAGAASSATISTQMASLRSGVAAGQGLNAGDGTGKGQRAWAQGFGTYAEQKIREEIAGFTSTTGGMAFGVDKRFRDDLVLGVAYSFSHTKVDSSESKTNTKVQSHQATLYGSHDFADLFVDGQLSYAYNDYDGERYIEVGAVSRRADGDFDGLQVSSQFNLGTTINEGAFRFTPTVGVSYAHVSIDSYNETQAGASNLRLLDQDYDMLSLNVKGKVAHTLQVDGVDVTPEVHLGYSHEVIHDKISTLSSFQGGGDHFTSTGFKPANNTYLGGVGVTWGGDSLPVDLTLTYDATVKDHFIAHSGLFKGVWRF